MSPRAAKRVSRGILAALIAMLGTQFVLQLAVGDKVATPHLVVVGDPDALGMAEVRADVEAHLGPGEELSGPGAVGGLLFGTIALIWGLTGALIVSRQPRNVAGWIFIVLAAAIALNGLAYAYIVYSVKVAAEPLPAADIIATLGEHVFIAMALIPLLVLFFPDGKPSSARWRWAARALLAGTGIVTITSFLTPGPLNNLVDAGILYANPFGVAAFAEDGPANVVVVASVLLIVGSSLATVIATWQRFRRARGEERQQMRWLVAFATIAGAGIAMILLGASVSTLLGLDESRGSDVLFLVFFAPTIVAVFLGIPVAYLIAIFRYGLWELDVVIRKAVIALVLTSLMAGVGLAILLTVGQFALWIGTPKWVSILVGVVVGMLSVPLLRLARRIAGRLTFGKRATPYEVLTAFGERVGETYSTEDVLPRMAQMLANGTGASSARVLLRVGSELREEARWPTDAEDPLDEHTVPVVDRGEELGALGVSMPASDPMNPSKEKLIADLAAQAGLVLRNVKLIEELRASRQRLVAAQDEERRKLERNIHDGAQQQLVALTVKLRLAQGLIGKDSAKAEAMLADLQAETQTALEDLRDLARGIYPPLLADKGLGAALDAQARKAAVPTTVEAEGIGRFDQDVESAVYFCALEALNNVAKYAEATSARVTLAPQNGVLTFEVIDDGRGFDPASTGYGTGIQGMADRLDAIGGSLEVRSEPGRGTRITGSVPVAGAAP